MNAQDQGIFTYFVKVKLLRMRILICLLALFLLLGCGSDQKHPDLSGIRLKLRVNRFEKELFELDSNRFSTALNSLLVRYPDFKEDFILNILGANPLWAPDTLATYVRGFVDAYRPVFDSSRKVFNDPDYFTDELLEPMKRFKYFFPGYKLPEQVITYIGPMDGFGDILSENALLIGLHQHLGKDYSMYSQAWLNDVYPRYITEKFIPENIAVNCMKNLMADLYPDPSEEQKLLVQMVEKGKRLYLLSMLLPEKPEHLLIGYSEAQMKDCYRYEKNIWNLFIQNNFLQTLDVSIIKNYIGEGPKTQELGETAPGNIGSFAGWQIVKKYMEKNPEVKPEQLMKLNPEEIFTEAKYKP